MILVTGIGVENYFKRTTVYECTNVINKLPVFIKITTNGALKLLTKGTSYIELSLNIHGESYSFSGTDTDYFDNEVFIENESGFFDKEKLKELNLFYVFYFDLLTGEYQVKNDIDGETQITANGVCKIKKGLE